VRVLSFQVGHLLEVEVGQSWEVDDAVDKVGFRVIQEVDKGEVAGV
jgi:hypothetical protein